MNREPVFAWKPQSEVIARAQLSRFIQFCNLTSFQELQKVSTENWKWFTDQLLRFLEIPFDPMYTEVADVTNGKPWPKWCVGAGLNISHACLDRHLATDTATQDAVVWEGEDGRIRSLSYTDLHAQVEKCSAALRALGIRKGDAAAIHLPMMPETVVVLLALARVGAIGVPLFSGYGPGAIEARLVDVEAKLVFTCDAFPRRGKTVAAKATADEAVDRCPSIEHMVVVEHLGTPVKWNAHRDLRWADFLEKGTGGSVAAEPTGAEDPLIVLYTSGTTGRPKGIQHTHCGFPLKSAQDMCFGTDVGPGDRICWITDIGWMMGPWLIYGALILGATIVLYDGAPDYPGADRLWAFCDRHVVNVLGISPTLIRALAAHGTEAPAKYRLDSLRILASTGEPWNPDPWWWFFNNVGRGKLPIINYSGGTEISGGILMSNPLLPIKPCGFSAACPGIAADIVDERGEPVRGSVGELVIREPWIGMARGFYKDPERYIETYWTRFPGMWAHGDWASIDEDGHWFIHGRSDDTIKVAGKRVGPAEVESILVSHQCIAEAAVIAIPDERKGNAIAAFCVLKVGEVESAERETELCNLVATELGKPLRPERLHFLAALPRTRNAKVMRRVLRAAYLDEDPGDLSPLENPQTLEAIRALRR